ncbi:MAG TPA: hypothetical protein PK011_07445, partial [Marinagarivorans sp.]|nr:hypothetical protein [Marinagarivorans sp.]
WLDQVLNERLEFAYREVEEAFILMQEVVFHLDKLKQQLMAFIEFDTDAAKMPFLLPAMEQLIAVPMQPIPDSLKDLWVGRMVVY